MSVIKGSHPIPLPYYGRQVRREFLEIELFLITGFYYGFVRLGVGDETVDPCEEGIDGGIILNSKAGVSIVDGQQGRGERETGTNQILQQSREIQHPLRKPIQRLGDPTLQIP
jgi:hypothetical protein